MAPQVQAKARAGDGLIGTFVWMAVYAGLFVVIGGLLLAMLVTRLVLMVAGRMMRA